MEFSIDYMPRGLSSGWGLDTACSPGSFISFRGTKAIGSPLFLVVEEDFRILAETESSILSN